MREMTFRARAKINLGLDVLRRREDGYHDLRMIMQTVGLYDQLTMRVTRDPRIRIMTNLSYLPVNEDNLIYKACLLLKEEFELEEGVVVDLEKRIPVAAGLAGGSSDAAAALVGMNILFNLGLSRQQLMERGVKIGADVPYCILRGTALAEGIGEKLTPLCPPPAMSVVLVKPNIHVSTKYVYTHLHLDETTQHPDIDGQIEALRNGSADRLIQGMGNVLETVTIPEYPIIARLKEQLLQMGAQGAMMSGSGPTVFALFSDPELAGKAFRILKCQEGLQAYLTRFWNPAGPQAE